MHRVTVWGVGCLASVIVSSTVANAQAPVPRQVLNAKAVLIANGASESYGADSYYRLTKYDGGPNRAYNSFYAAIKSWDHYDLVGETTDADLVLVIKFANPVVDRLNAEAAADPQNGWVYDPQLNLSLNDPKTGLPLWTITEHIQPGGDKAEANARYDDAVTRLVDDLKRLILRPDLSATTDNPPPGAIDVARRAQRDRHAGAGMMIGLVAGAALALSEGSHDPCPDITHASGCMKNTQRLAAQQLITGLGVTALGALIGWFWPVSN